MKTRYIVSYDICDPKRLRLVFAIAGTECDPFEGRAGVFAKRVCRGERKRE